MANDNWSKIKEIVDGAIHRRPEDRPAYLNEACSGNDAVRREVESLLSSLESADEFMEAPVIESIVDKTHPLNRGQMLGHYEILRPIGEGGMGAVYLGRDTKLGRHVAVKVLNKRYERRDDNIRRFIREAKAASALNHPNILIIFEIGEFERSHFMVSEYVEGRTLREIMNSGTLDLATIVDIAGQIASALAAAHKARIVHRDLKPENVIVRDDGYVKVLDFGLAKLLPEDVSSGLSGDERTEIRDSTVSGMILGTVNYMSPEQAKGKKVDERTDIFSLGVVLYEMITGRAPFASDSIPETFARLIEHEPDPIATYLPGVPDELEQITSKMLQKAPEDRYQSMREAEDDLRAIDSGLLGSFSERRRQLANTAPTALMQLDTKGGANTTAENTQSSVRWYRRWPMAVLGVLLLASIGIGGYLLRQSAIASSNEIRSVAVMPFLNESGNPDIEYLSDGMTDTLIGSLSELPNIKIKSRTAVFRYKGKEIDPKAIGRELGVQAIVSGRVSQREGRTNITLEVVDTETEDVIFSSKYDRAQSELVALQSEIAHDVSGKLKSKLSGAEEAKVTKTYTADPEALQLYLKGQFYTHKGGRDNVLLATDYLNKAIERDPNYALAYAGLALNYDTYPLYNIAPPAEYGPKAKAAAVRAVELDDSLAEAHVALGKFHETNSAEQEFRRAIGLDPNNAEAHRALSSFLAYSKRFDEAIAEGEKAQELDPSSSVIATNLCAVYGFARRPDEAIELCRRAHEMDPMLYVPLGYLGFAETQKGRYTEAIATFRDAIRISDGAPNAKSHLAYALAKAGQRDEALKLVDELKRQAAREYISSFHFAIPYIGLGNKDEAFFWLEKGVDEKSIGFGSLYVHPWFDDVRSDPRFAALLKRVKMSES